jgi:ATP-dependent DNA helicase RecG
MGKFRGQNRQDRRSKRRLGNGFSFFQHFGRLDCVRRVAVSPQAKRYKIEGKNVLAFYIPSSDIKPVYFNGVQNTFIRTGSGDQQASEFEINALYRDQTFGTMSGKTVDGTTVDSLNAESYSNFRDYLQRMVPRLHYNKLNNESFNSKLHIVKNGKLTYGGLLFLGKNEEICSHPCREILF